jgi:hypothetical protein
MTGQWLLEMRGKLRGYEAGPATGDAAAAAGARGGGRSGGRGGGRGRGGARGGGGGGGSLGEGAHQIQVQPYDGLPQHAEPAEARALVARLEATHVSLTTIAVLKREANYLEAERSGRRRGKHISPLHHVRWWRVVVDEVGE